MTRSNWKFALFAVALVSLSLLIVLFRGQKPKSLMSQNPTPPIESRSKSRSAISSEAYNRLEIPNNRVDRSKTDQAVDSLVDMTRLDDPEYRKRFKRHQSILQFLKSPKMDEPAYQEVLVILLENGYDIADWPDVIGGIISISMWEQIEGETYEIYQMSESDIAERKKEQAPILETYVTNSQRHLTHSLGITDPGLLSQLTSVRLPFENGEPILGHPDDLVVKPGDRLLDDEDWLTPRFEQAIERYRQRQTKSSQSISP